MSSFLDKRLATISERGTLRELPGSVEGIDFWSNDYLGLARTRRPDHGPKHLENGSTGSRLISGDRDEYHQLEARIAQYHGYGAALLFPSGYTAFLGLLSSLLTRADTILYDELSHACCRDGIRLGHARSLRFAHNDLQELRRKLGQLKSDGQVFVLTESRFSMDGDVAPLAEIALICAEFDAQLIVDEAHSGGLDGEGGRGMVHQLGLQGTVFATVITYGKAFGAHGAVVLGSLALRRYLVNTARAFIYSTAPAAAQYAGIEAAYDALETEHESRYATLMTLVDYYQSKLLEAHLSDFALNNRGPIQLIKVAGNGAVMHMEKALRSDNLLVKGIRSPTVPAGSERLRICLHAFNTEAEIDRLITVLRRELVTFAG